jgi:hypothetical protein
MRKDEKTGFIFIYACGNLPVVQGHIDSFS